MVDEGAVRNTRDVNLLFAVAICLTSLPPLSKAASSPVNCSM
jgi:hypothetical protein